MQCKARFKRLRARPRAALQPPVAMHVPQSTSLPPGLVRQLACPLTSMGEVERLLAHLHCAKALGYF
ncbi:MAG TPA: hypothetical protein VHA82_11155 [Ramlibacter sp.]|uniref:hypothetical protein n=1 Tax=Ramlibacter sp. TaxID=1917967 RepID=UPI002CCECACC|nr:hypothetical protein [Ramlibacter sp.]HVZ44358.1 hypothetical protein [Ramlibacter sp.]